MMVQEIWQDLAMVLPNSCVPNILKLSTVTVLHTN